MTKLSRGSAVAYVLIVVAVAVVGWSIWYGVSQRMAAKRAAEEREAKRDKRTTEERAYDAAKNMVLEVLAAPASAQFQPFSPGAGMEDGDTWSVSVTVDSQNKFGALLRSRFLVKLREQEPGRWKCATIFDAGSGETLYQELR